MSLLAVSCSSYVEPSWKSDFYWPENASFIENIRPINKDLPRRCLASRYLVLSHLKLLYHTIPYHTIPYHTIPYHTIPYHTIPYHTIPYHTIKREPVSFLSSLGLPVYTVQARMKLVRVPVLSVPYQKLSLV